MEMNRHFTIEAILHLCRVVPLERSHFCYHPPNPPHMHIHTYPHICVCVCAHLHVKSLQLCLTLCDSMDCSPLGSSVHGILQARILEWIAMLFSRGSSQPRDRTCVNYVSCILQAGSLVPPGKLLMYIYTHIYPRLYRKVEYTSNC